MEHWLGVSLDWGKIFTPHTPLLEIFLRGSIVYLGIFTLLRFVFRRQAGTVGMTDLLVLVLLADAAQNAMAADYISITDGILLVAVILLWSYALERLGYHIPAIERFVHPPPLPLVKDGKCLYRNLRHELITEAELMSHARQQGIESLEGIKAAYMESDGRISLVPYEQPAGGQEEQRQF